MDEIFINVDHVSKKFCKDLKRSLWYGVKDVSSEIIGKKLYSDNLREDEFWAIRDLSFSLKKGQCLGLIGRNGSGKSTVLKMLIGVIKPDIGEISIRGNIGAIIDLTTGFNPILTGRENIFIRGEMLGFSQDQIIEKVEDIISFADIGDFLDTPMQNYSSGMKIRLGFSITSQLKPDIMIIDEVLAVGDIGFKSKAITKINELRQDCIVILVSHMMGHIRRLCTEVLFLKHGQVECYEPSNPKAAINKYLMSIPELIPKVIKDLSVSINSIIINGKDRKQVEVISGNDLDIQIQYNCTLENILLYCSTEFLNEEGILKKAYSSKKDGIYFSSKKENIINLMLPRFSIPPGKYRMRINIYKAKTSSKERLLKKEARSIVVNLVKEQVVNRPIWRSSK